MNGIRLGGCWGSQLSEARLQEVAAAAIKDQKYDLKWGEWVLDLFGLTNHKEAYQAVHDLAKARHTLIELSEDTKSSNTEKAPKILIAFGKALKAATTLENLAHPADQDKFRLMPSRSIHGELEGGQIIVAGIGDQIIFECTFYPHGPSHEFDFSTDVEF